RTCWDCIASSDRTEDMMAASGKGAVLVALIGAAASVAGAWLTARATVPRAVQENQSELGRKAQRDAAPPSPVPAPVPVQDLSGTGWRFSILSPGLNKIEVHDDGYLLVVANATARSGTEFRSYLHLEIWANMTPELPASAVPCAQQQSYV